MEVYSPASGIIINIKKLRKDIAIIRIFISPFHAHTVCSPINATVDRIDSIRGWRIPAFLPMAVQHNSNVKIYLNNKRGEELVTTVFAGLLTYNLFSLIQPQQKLNVLDEIVEIRFGSLVEIKGKIDLSSELKFGKFVELGDQIGVLMSL